MHILIEEYKYSTVYTDESLSYLSNKEFMAELDREYYSTSKDTVSFGCVGYYFSQRLHDCVIILPKAILIEDKRTSKTTLLIGNGNIIPEKIFDMDSTNQKDPVIPESIRNDLRSFGVWIYRALSHYYSDNPTSTIISKRTLLPTRKDKEHQGFGSLFEVILELLRFSRDNQVYLSRIIAESHTGNRIKWRKTISHEIPVIKNGLPYYLNPIRQKAQPNLEEELIVIFYSILHYISKEFGFPNKQLFGISLISDNVFKTYIAGRGKIRLQQIKNNYFSDNAIRLWKLCMAFFDEQYVLRTNPRNQEHLLAKSFNEVFEDMIDFLIGDPIEKKFRVFKDRRQLDHIYKYNSIIGDTEIYYIGDSKYYPLKNDNDIIGPDLSSDSIYKQFIYALNVQQILMEESDGDIAIFDEKTESYTIIPNFFISAYLKPTSSSNDETGYRFSYNENGIEFINDKHDETRHFDDRLFDRNSLKLFYFKVNFLFILKNYALAQRAWKAIARDFIQTNIRKKLFGEDGQYSLYTLEGSTDNIKNMSWSEYKQIVGKITKISDKYYIAIKRDNNNTRLVDIKSILNKYKLSLVPGN